MEWDKFWAENKKVLEENSPRYMGVDDKEKVVFTITNVPTEIEIVSVQIHPQKPEMGNRVLRRCNKLYVDQIDATTFSEGEIVTFIRWGNFQIDTIVKQCDMSGHCTVASMEGRYLPESTDFKKLKRRLG